MNNMLRFSVIIPVYNTKIEQLNRCVSSLICQNNDNAEILLIDDGSTDSETVSLCDKYADENELVYTIHKHNGGAADARNCGLKRIRGEWIIFVDPDDYVETGYFEKLDRIITDNEGLELIVFDYIEEYRGKSVIHRLPCTTGIIDASIEKSIRIANFSDLIINGKAYPFNMFALWNKAYKTSLIKDNRIWFDVRARKGQDVIFNAEALLLPRRFYYLPIALYHYNCYKGSITNKYNEKVVYYNEVAFDNYERIIKDYKLTNEYNDAKTTRICTRIYSCLRLFYFHPENKRNYLTKRKDIIDLIDREPYKSAIQNCSMNYMTLNQKVFVYCVRYRFVELLFILVKARAIVEYLKGLRYK